MPPAAAGPWPHLHHLTSAMPGCSSGMRGSQLPPASRASSLSCGAKRAQQAKRSSASQPAPPAERERPQHSIPAGATLQHRPAVSFTQHHACAPLLVRRPHSWRAAAGRSRRWVGTTSVGSGPARRSAGCQRAQAARDHLLQLQGVPGPAIACRRFAAAASHQVSAAAAAGAGRARLHIQQPAPCPPPAHTL